ncbi:MAG: hypothetical protein FJ403_17990 [Verrucomicrobia bacterium]|nr:hypothetical protein [Verrucomicrobiota bacterium]
MSNPTLQTEKVSRQQGRHSEANLATARFREHFKRSLVSCVKRRFSVEECFGAIWQETLDEVTLSDGEQAALYPELLEWARQWKR